MKNIFSLTAMAVAVGLASTSCLNDDPEYSQELNLNYSGEGCFNRVVDLETGEALVSGNPSYLMKFVTDGTKNTMTMEMANIQLSPGFSGLAFKLPEQNYTYNQDTDYFTSSGHDIVPLNAGSSYKFDSFSLRFIPTRIIDGLNCPVYLIDYTVNGRYQVTVFPTSPVLFSTSSAIRDNDGTVYVNKNIDSYVTMKIDPQKMLASVTIAKAQFSHEMISGTFIIKDIPVIIDGTTVRMATPAEQPQTIYNINNKPFNKSTVTDFALHLDISSGVGLITGTFVIDNPIGSEEGYEPETFDVNINLNYFFKTDGKD